jgi:hypothetical protein
MFQGENKSNDTTKDCFFTSVQEEGWTGLGGEQPPTIDQIPPPPDDPTVLSDPTPLTYNALVSSVDSQSGQTSQTPLLDRLACLVKSKSFDAEDKKSRTPGSPDIRVEDAHGSANIEGEWSWAPGNDVS